MSVKVRLLRSVSPELTSASTSMPPSCTSTTGTGRGWLQKLFVKVRLVESMVVSQLRSAGGATFVSVVGMKLLGT